MISEKYYKQAKNELEYKDGILYWKTDRLKLRDKRAGTYSKWGYEMVSVGGKRLRSHKIIWYIFHGEIPQYIDHIDRDVKNNRIENLRSCTNSQNQRNKNRKENYGITWSKNSQKWLVRIYVFGRNIHLGYFEDREKALEVRREAEDRYWKDGFKPS